ncbi:MAG: hypothetical protein K2X32_06850 [Phycisphaerales bacterium]|nr:hypothetical protein [Phycisphaerales bacterium]
MEPLTLLVNPPKSKRPKKKAKRKAPAKKTSTPRRATARKPSPAATQKGPDVAKKSKKKAAKRKSSGKRFSSIPRGGGGTRGFFSKFTPESPVMLAAGATTGIIASTAGVTIIGSYLPVQVTDNRIFRPVAQLAIGGAGYYFTKGWSRSFAIGHFGGCVGTAAYELVGPYILDALERMGGAPSLSGGAYTRPGSGFAPGENGDTVLASAVNTPRQLAGYASGAPQFRGQTTHPNLTYAN